MKARGVSLPQKTDREFGEDGDEGELPEDELRSLATAISSARGALAQVRHMRRWRARSAGVGGGFIVQFYISSAAIQPPERTDAIPGTRLLRIADIR